MGNVTVRYIKTTAYGRAARARDSYIKSGGSYGKSKSKGGITVTKVDTSSPDSLIYQSKQRKANTSSSSGTTQPLQTKQDSGRNLPPSAIPANVPTAREFKEAREQQIRATLSPENLPLSLTVGLGSSGYRQAYFNSKEFVGSYAATAFAKKAVEQEQTKLEEQAKSGLFSQEQIDIKTEQATKRVKESYKTGFSLGSQAALNAVEKSKKLKTKIFKEPEKFTITSTNVPSPKSKARESLISFGKTITRESPTSVNKFWTSDRKSEFKRVGKTTVATLGTIYAPVIAGEALGVTVGLTARAGSVASKTGVIVSSLPTAYVVGESARRSVVSNVGSTYTGIKSTGFENIEAVKAAQTAATPTSKVGRFVYDLPAGTVFGSSKKYKLELEAQGKSLGYEGEALKDFVKGGTARRFAGATGEFTGLVAGSAVVETAGRRLFSSSFTNLASKQFTLLKSKSFGAFFVKGVKTIAPLGFVEGSTQSIITQTSRYQKPDIKQAVTEGATGAVVAGTLGGLIVAAPYGKPITKKVIKYVERGSNLLDTTEKPADILSGLSFSSKKYPTVRTGVYTTTQTIKGKDKEIVSFAPPKPFVDVKGMKFESSKTNAFSPISITTPTQVKTSSGSKINSFTFTPTIETKTPVTTNVPTTTPTKTFIPVTTNIPTLTPVPTVVPTFVPTFVPTLTPVPTVVPTFVPTSIPTYTQTPVQTTTFQGFAAIPPPFGGLLGGKGKGFDMDRGVYKDVRTASLDATLFNIKGSKKSSILERSGLVTRAIITKPKRKKVNGKRKRK